MGRNLKLFLGILFLIVCVTLTTSCGKKTYESEYYRYQLMKDEYGVKYATIIGLTAVGQKQETLIIPTTIMDKYPVRSLGSQSENKEGLKSENLKKLYMPSTIRKIENKTFYFPSSLEVLYCGNYCTEERKNLDFESITQLLNGNSPIIYFAEKTLNNSPYKDNPNYRKANVVYYMNNDGYNDVYFVDDVDDGKLNVIPEEPTRYYKNQKIRFKDWYKEREGINFWNFKGITIPSKEYDEEGNYIFKEIAFYGKWIED